jgi:hypothetical protein
MRRTTSTIYVYIYSCEVRRIEEHAYMASTSHIASNNCHTTRMSAKAFVMQVTHTPPLVVNSKPTPHQYTRWVPIGQPAPNSCQTRLIAAHGDAHQNLADASKATEDVIGHGAAYPSIRQEKVTLRKILPFGAWKFLYFSKLTEYGIM